MLPAFVSVPIFRAKPDVECDPQNTVISIEDDFLGEARVAEHLKHAVVAHQDVGDEAIQLTAPASGSQPLEKHGTKALSLVPVCHHERDLS